MTHSLQVAGTILLIASGGVAAALAQGDAVPVGTKISGGMVWFPKGGSMSEALMDAAGTYLQPVTGHPYFAEQVIESSRRAADGTPTKQPSQRATLYRDSEGRIRTEIHVPRPAHRVEDSISDFIEIIDPVAGYRYFLDPLTKTATRSPWPPDIPGRDGARTSSASASSTVPATPGVESLGTQYIEGVLAEGTRSSSTFLLRLGGKEEQVPWTSEAWVAPELKINVLTKQLSRFGEATISLNGLLQAEPDASLFRVPADYKLIDR